MIGWLLGLGLMLGDTPAGHDAYTAAAAKAEEVYAMVADACQTAATETAQPAPAEEPGIAEVEAVYDQFAAAARDVLGDAFDAVQRALRADQPVTAAIPPVDFDALYADASAVVGRAVGEAFDDFRTALRSPPAPAASPSAKHLASGDPLKPVIAEAANRFALPELWIRAVMRVESNGVADATSPKGAMGLMQVMPTTYAGLSDRYGLGENAYELRNNVLAGSAYLREMYDRYGAAGFLAAYNAGPGRYEDSFCRRCSLPEETRRYVASVRLAFGEILFGEPKSRFYEPLSVSPDGALLLKRTGQPVPVAERLALHSLVERAVKRAGAAGK